MSRSRRTALVVCPGRGVYNAAELGYFKTHHADKADLLAGFDRQRAQHNQPLISALDQKEKFSRATFTRGDNASGLIYACSYADFLSIDRTAFDIVAVTGNSMGWYTALACAGAVSPENGFRTVNTTGAIMHQHSIGGQIVYPFVTDEWKADEGMHETLQTLVETTDGLHISIHFGGMMVLAGTDSALDHALKILPPLQGRFPLRLPNHAAFHSPLMAENSERARSILPPDMFHQPSTPMIDGRGKVWNPKACNLMDLWDYTFGTQIIDTYDFTRSVQTGLKEFAPDCIIVLGPGNTLGGATAQAMLLCGWDGLTTKSDFSDRQSSDPLMLAMGHKDQRSLTTSP